MKENADFIRAQKASTFFKAPSVLFDRLKELKIIPESAEEQKFQMVLKRQEKKALKMALNTVWDLYIAKKRRLNRQMNIKSKKLERKKRKMNRLEDRIEEYMEELEECEKKGRIEVIKEQISISEDRIDSLEETIIYLEQHLKEIEAKFDDKGNFNANILKYDPNLSPLWSELQNLVYDGVSRAREKYGEYATVPSTKNNGHDRKNIHERGDIDGREIREQ